ncbi:hypothetical protein [Porphyrobacter sp. YT40]|uniref:hypothetical protein n=1 Tax=Porphyrobacter sp. YT40 TaxID=2547601 RepID=UPI001144294F|nr:hypothetical protein [Porphyrobacter sp. YT40]QDH33185.1 hypothetical protein E2E27_01840 [Porphyrobacter sp. YT40]
MTAEEKIYDLEARLSRYHEALAEAIQERDRLALDAAWGVHYSLFALFGTAIAIFAIHRYVDGHGWLAGGLIAIALFVVPMAIHAWSNGERMKEVERLAKLPDWHG